MAGLESVFSAEPVQRIGWALLHSLWQAAGAAGVLSVVLLALRRSSANARYVAACVALAIMAALPTATALWWRAPRVPGAPPAPGHTPSRPTGIGRPRRPVGRRDVSGGEEFS